MRPVGTSRSSPIMQEPLVRSSCLSLLLPAVSHRRSTGSELTISAPFTMSRFTPTRWSCRQGSKLLQGHSTGCRCCRDRRNTTRYSPFSARPATTTRRSNSNWELHSPSPVPEGLLVTVQLLSRERLFQSRELWALQRQASCWLPSFAESRGAPGKWVVARSANG